MGLIPKRLHLRVWVVATGLLNWCTGVPIDLPPARVISNHECPPRPSGLAYTHCSIWPMLGA